MIGEIILIDINIVSHVITTNVQNKWSKKYIEKLDVNGLIEIKYGFIILINEI